VGKRAVSRGAGVDGDGAPPLTPASCRPMKSIGSAWAGAAAMSVSVAAPKAAERRGDRGNMCMVLILQVGWASRFSIRRVNE
jgi:hypothetical protein